MYLMWIVSFVLRMLTDERYCSQPQGGRAETEMFWFVLMLPVVSQRCCRESDSASCRHMRTVFPGSEHNCYTPRLPQNKKILLFIHARPAGFISMSHFLWRGSSGGFGWGGVFFARPCCFSPSCALLMFFDSLKLQKKFEVKRLTQASECCCRRCSISACLTQEISSIFQSWRSPSSSWLHQKQ